MNKTRRQNCFRYHHQSISSQYLHARLIKRLSLYPFHAAELRDLRLIHNHQPTTKANQASYIDSGIQRQSLYHSPTLESMTAWILLAFGIIRELETTALWYQHESRNHMFRMDYCAILVVIMCVLGKCSCHLAKCCFNSMSFVFFKRPEMTFVSFSVCCITFSYVAIKQISTNVVCTCMCIARSHGA